MYTQESLSLIGRFEPSHSSLSHPGRFVRLLGSIVRVSSCTVDNIRHQFSMCHTVTLPGPIPAANFWSFMVYDVQTRSILETDQKTGGVDSKREGMNIAKDGGVTIYFSPKAPEGQENNWAQTMPDKGIHVLLRLYGLEQAWFDKSWMPGDFEAVEKSILFIKMNFDAQT